LTWTVANLKLPFSTNNVRVTPNGQFFASDEFAIHQSADQGSTWKVVAPISSFAEGPIVYAPSKPSTMFAGQIFGALESVDGGATWFSLSHFGPNAPTAIVVNPANANTVYAAFSGLGGAVYMSTGGGSTWTRTLSQTSVYAMAINPLNPSDVYVGAQTYPFAGGQSGGVLESTDGGSTFQTVLPNVEVTSLAINPVNPQLIYAGTKSGGIYQSSNGGASWTSVGGSTIVASVAVLAFDPQNPANMFAATSGQGVFFSSNGGSSWSPDNQGLSDLNVVSMAVDASSPYSVLAATSGGNVFTATIPAGSVAPPTTTPILTPTPTTTPTTTPTPTATPTPTTTATPTPINTTAPFTGMLSPASDTGVSSSDGITDDNRPTFVGTAPAGQTVTLFEFANGGSTPVAVGQAIAADAGTWSVTPAQPLADGEYVIEASVTGGNATTVIQILPTATEGRLVIDTSGPRINNVAIDAPVGQILLNLAENGSGLNTRQLMNPATYIVTGPSGRRDAHVALALLPGDANGSTNLALTLDGGRALRRGRYIVRIRAGALGDVAGNPLNGSLYFGFPTGSGTSSGDFMMAFQTDGVSATTPTLPGFIAAGDARYLAGLRKRLRNGPV
jgi:photosystem II stability/assembly factor-like uncharacterized protein